MKSEIPAEIPGATAWERAVNLAGLLAEMGVQRIELTSAGKTRELLARETDLVGEIVKMAERGGTLRAGELRLVITSRAVLIDG